MMMMIMIIIIIIIGDYTVESANANGQNYPQ